MSFCEPFAGCEMFSYQVGSVMSSSRKPGSPRRKKKFLIVEIAPSFNRVVMGILTFMLAVFAERPSLMMRIETAEIEERRFCVQRQREKS